MNDWHEPINRENIADFYNLYAPAAYKSVYRILGDTTRTENVLLDSFIELYRERNSYEAQDPVNTFGAILQKKAKQMEEKYPLPVSYSFQVRSLDEFTKTTLLADLNRKIDSVQFKAIDMISSTAAHRIPGGGGISSLSGNIHNFGITLTLIIQLLVVGLIIAAITYFGAMSTFKVREAIPDYRVAAEQNTDEKLVAALQYLPLQLQRNTVFSDQTGDLPIAVPEDTSLTTEASESISEETELTATQG
ncbi:MAG: hypothetical protein JW780_03035 [Clostridiales bacterium]|nr:hypothetical protein [Clostridiales bacterium]